MSACLEATGLTKRYPEGERPALVDASFAVAEGGILALLGPSGSGKSTALRLVAGFERPEAGSVRLAGTLLADPSVHVAPEARRIGLVFQDFALFPHLSVRDNVAFGLSRRPAAERAARVDELLELAGLSGLADRAPHDLSGGEQQRVSVARALAPNPRLVLLDEPFSNLDAALRRTLRTDVRALWKAAGVTGMLVTHDREEAFAFADRIAVLREGRVLQAGTPEGLSAHPACACVASDLCEATLVSGTAQGGHAVTAWGRLPVTKPGTGEATLLLRPEQIGLGREGDGPRARVVSREFQGRGCRVEAQFADGSYCIFYADTDAPCTPGTPVTLRILSPARPVRA